MLWDRCLSSMSHKTLVYCGQTVGWIKMTLGKLVGLGPGHIVLDRDPGLLPQITHSPQFLAHGQMARLIKMPLDAEVGLDLSDIVLDGYPAPSPPKGGRSLNFRPMFVVA